MLPLPGPDEDPNRFIKKPHHHAAWSLDQPLDQTIMSRIGRTWPRASRIRLHARSPQLFRETLRQLAQAAARLADPAPLRELLRLTGRTARRTLRHHNLAVQSLPELQALARTNPGALGWWLHHFSRSQDEPKRANHFVNTAHNPLYRKPDPPPWAVTAVTAPGLVAQVRTQFRQAGGRPAGHPRRGADRKAVGPACRGPTEPSIRAQTTPAALSGQEDRRLGVRHSPAQYHAVRLPLRASAGRREKDVPVHQDGSPVSTTLLNVTDYAQHEPEATLRSGSWKGLIKASARRHDRMIREAQLLTAGNILGKRPETVSDAAWSAPLTGAELPGGYQATLLRSPRDLLAETNLLNHCLGLSDEYAQRCWDVAPQDRPASPRNATTLEAGPGVRRWLAHPPASRPPQPAAHRRRAAGRAGTAENMGTSLPRSDMNRFETALAELREILEAQPPEPYTGRPRRPNGYRDAPEYKKWSRQRQEWIARLLQWETAGLEVPESDRRAEIRFYGATVPGAAFERQPDGCIKHIPAHPYLTPDPFPQWAPPFPTPKPKERIDKFLDRLGHAVTIWHVSRHMDDLLDRRGVNMHQRFYRNNRNDLLYHDYIRGRNRNYISVQHQWLEAVRRIMDSKAIATLSRIAGQPVHHNMRNHNLAVSCHKVIREATEANPGAVAWWMRLVNNPEGLAHVRGPDWRVKDHLEEFMVSPPAGITPTRRRTREPGRWCSRFPGIRGRSSAAPRKITSPRAAAAGRR